MTMTEKLIHLLGGFTKRELKLSCVQGWFDCAKLTKEQIEELNGSPDWGEKTWRVIESNFVNAKKTLEELERGTVD